MHKIKEFAGAESRRVTNDGSYVTGCKGQRDYLFILTLSSILGFRFYIDLLNSHVTFSNSHSLKVFHKCCT